MTKDIHMAQLFSKHLFWDVDVSCLDLEKDKDLIIPRALIATTPSTFVSDILKLEAIYTKSVIVRELKNTKERVSNQICQLVARRYHIKQFVRFSK